MIRFLLDIGAGRTEEIALGDDVPADLTVLDWLRLNRRLTGTKEGCGSGDCGACTVVVASLAEDVDGVADDASPDVMDGSPLVHESVNACIAFVGALHGRLLVTVESLARGEDLHPVQRAMVDEHGSQCGFCTPGFVMSLYALYRAPDAPRVTFAGRRASAADASGAPIASPANGSGAAEHDPRPVDLDEPTPVVAYRSAANADAAETSIGNGTREGEGGDAAGGSASRGGSGQGPENGGGGGGATDRVPTGLPMIMATGWLDGFETDDPDGLSHRVDRALGGNLCRCTGYRPIKRAAALALAERTTSANGVTGAGEKGEAELERERRIAARLREIAAESPTHSRFHAPDSLAAFAALVERYPDAPLLGGGTDLALEVTQKLRDLPRLIHVARVPELARVEFEDDVLTLGAAVSLTRCRALLGERVTGAGELLLRFGSDPIRNRGTIGGNIASASPIGDLPPLLLALDAMLVLQRGDAVRTLPLDDFFTGYRQTRLVPGEFVRAVRVPLLGARDRCAVYKVSKRMEDDISSVCGAFRLTLDGSRIVAARAAFGGMAATPARAHGAEAALVGAPFERRTMEAAGDALDEDFTPMSDARASAGYRARVARNLLLRVFLEAGGDDAVPVRLSLADTPGVAPGDDAPSFVPPRDATRVHAQSVGEARGER